MQKFTNIWCEKNNLDVRTESNKMLLERLENRKIELIFLLGNFVRSVYLEIENTNSEVIDKWQSDIVHPEFYDASYYKNYVSKYLKLEY